MATTTFTAVIVDTASIQRYVFASNKLKENIGASFIIEELLYKKLMIECICKAADEHAPALFTEWKDSPATIQILQPDTQRTAEIGYIGGGNSMILFRNAGDARDFISLFSLRVLQHFPGIRVIYGKVDDKKEADLTDKHAFKQLRKELSDSLIACKNSHFASFLMYKPGIVEDCPSSNDAQEQNEGGDTGWISGSTKAKLLAASQAFAHVQGQYESQLNGNYVLNNEIEKFGQPSDKSYVAIVHADGNGIGKKFLEAGSLEALRVLSLKVSNIANGIMEKLIAETIRVVELDRHLDENEREFKLEKFIPAKNASPEEEALRDKPILPIRPILAAGDDITFVCEGRLGVYLASEILKYFEAEKIEGTSLTACAGVAICKTHYPFFKAYTLAEELIHMSKDEAKRNGNTNSWLHFLPIHSGFNGDLEDVLKSQFSVNGKSLLSGPYRKDNSDGTYESLVNKLNYYAIGDKENGWPRSKLMEMRDAFRLDESSQKLFLAEAKARNLQFEDQFEVLHPTKSSGSVGSQLIYDAILLADFFPETLKQPAP